MAKSVKTDLFAGMMNVPKKKSVVKKTEDSKSVKGETVKVEENLVTKKEKPAETKGPEGSEIIKNQSISLDQFLKKIEKPSANSHTFYLKDTVFKKLTEAAKEKGTSPSKLLEALIEMTL